MIHRDRADDASGKAAVPGASVGSVPQPAIGAVAVRVQHLAADIDDPHSATAQSLLLRAVYTDIRFRGAGIVNRDGAIVVTSFGRVEPPKPVPGGVLFNRDRDGLQIVGPVRELIIQETSVALAMNGPRGRVFYLLVDPGLLTYFLEMSCAQLNKGKIDGLLQGVDRMTQQLPNHLILEITESESINNGNTTLLESIERLRRHGALFAIDDFGTGYSSLAYLNRLHIDYMKIDRHFLQGIDQPGASTAVLEGVISLGKRLDLTMVAEGVETSAQRDILVAAGVQYGQGWLFSHPLTLAEYVDFLRSRAAEGSSIEHQPLNTSAVSVGAA